MNSRVLLTTCSTLAPLLIMMASLKSGRSDRKRRNDYKFNSEDVLLCTWQSNDWMRKCVRTSSFLCINANQSEVFPQRLQEVIQVQLHPTTEICQKNKNKKKQRKLLNSHVHTCIKRERWHTHTDIWPDDNTVRSASQAVHLLDGDLIHLIVHL